MTESNQQYAAGEHPDWEPPVTSIGVIGWLRKNLFDGYVNSILTLFALYLLYLYVPPLINWLFLDAVWSGDSREVCEVEGTGALDVFLAVSRDDGGTWKRRNLSKTADKSSLFSYPGVSQKPMLKVKDNMIFTAWTDKYCRGGRPGYAITVCPDTDGDGTADPCEICRETDQGTVCFTDYPGDDAYWQDDLYGAGGPQRSVTYDDYPEMGEVPFSCVWTARGVIDPDTAEIQWFKPERVTSGRRDAYQIFAGAATDVAFATAERSEACR